MNDFPTRRDLRAAEKLAGSVSQVFDAPYQPEADRPSEIGTRRSIRRSERNPVPTLSVIEPESQVHPPAIEHQSLATQTQPSDLKLDIIAEDSPKTSEIVLPAAEQTPTFSIMLGSGIEPKTGSIQLPILSSDTGELKVVKTARESDEAMNLSVAEGYVSNVQPVSANDWMIEVDSLNLVPQATNSLFRQMHTAVLGSVILVGVGGLVLAAYMLGIFN